MAWKVSIKFVGDLTLFGPSVWQILFSFPMFISKIYWKDETVSGVGHTWNGFHRRSEALGAPCRKYAGRPQSHGQYAQEVISNFIIVIDNISGKFKGTDV